MTGCALGYLNRTDSGALSGGGAVASLPVENLADVQPGKLYRTIGTSAFAVLDAGGAVDFDAIAAINVNLSSGATKRVRLSSVDATGAAGDLYDSGVVGAGVDPRFRGMLHVLDATVSGRYLRVDLADASLAWIDWGRLYAGPLFRPAKNFLKGNAFGYRDLGTKKMTPGGQVHDFSRARLRIATLTFAFLNEVEFYENVFEIDRLVGMTSDLLYIRDPASAYLAETWMWCQADDTTPALNPQYAIWEKTFRLTERLGTFSIAARAAGDLLLEGGGFLLTEDGFRIRL
jgi:hypothetical protein